MHVDAPAKAEYLPTGHAVHTGESDTGENVPAPQLEHVAAPASEDLPAGHAVHTEAPVSDEKVPAAQLVQLAGTGSPGVPPADHVPGGQAAHAAVAVPAGQMGTDNCAHAVRGGQVSY